MSRTVRAHQRNRSDQKKAKCISESGNEMPMGRESDERESYEKKETLYSTVYIL